MTEGRLKWLSNLVWRTLLCRIPYPIPHELLYWEFFSVQGVFITLEHRLGCFKTKQTIFFGTEFPSSAFFGFSILAQHQKVVS